MARRGPSSRAMAAPPGRQPNPHHRQPHRLLAQCPRGGSSGAASPAAAPQPASPSPGATPHREPAAPEHQRSAAWSSARIPRTTNCRRLQRCRRVEDHCPRHHPRVERAILPPRRDVRVARIGRDSAAESVVAARRRGLGAAPSQKPAPPHHAAAPISEPASVMPRQTARHATFDPSITDPPPSATMRSASFRISAAGASTSRPGYARIQQRRRPAAPIAAFAEATSAPWAAAVVTRRRASATLRQRLGQGGARCALGHYEVARSSDPPKTVSVPCCAQIRWHFRAEHRLCDAGAIMQPTPASAMASIRISGSAGHRPPAPGRHCMAPSSGPNQCRARPGASAARLRLTGPDGARPSSAPMTTLVRCRPAQTYPAFPPTSAPPPAHPAGRATRRHDGHACSTPGADVPPRLHHGGQRYRHAGNRRRCRRTTIGSTAVPLQCHSGLRRSFRPNTLHHRRAALSAAR